MPQPDKRSALQVLTKARLRELVEAFELKLPALRHTVAQPRCRITLTYLHLIRGAERRAIDALEPATGTILAPQHGSQPNISDSKTNLRR